MNSKTFFDTYEDEIVPKLKALDLLVKTSAKGIDPSALSQILLIPKKELRAIMARNGICKINKKNLYIIMREGSSAMCEIFRRELEKGSPLVYTREDISYIYGIDRRDVDYACSSLGIKETTELFFPDIFRMLPS